MIELFSLVTLSFAVLSTGFFLRHLAIFRRAPLNAIYFGPKRGEPNALASGVLRENVALPGPWLAPSAHKVDGIGAPLAEAGAVLQRGRGFPPLPAVSVLIPARDEEAGIRKTLSAALANQGVDLEIVVLDDQSCDATASIVEEMAATDDRLRLVRGRGLPAGWCGKQYACHQLAEHAKHDDFLFIDADVRLAPNAIVRCLLQRQTNGVDLLSGFPRQIVGTLGEALLIPLIHIVLLTYLPFRLMRKTSRPSASAGCGQLFLTTRSAYQRSGGHAEIKASLHDGVTLPRAYRRVGLATDVFDASDLAACRMYHGWFQTLRGLMKNAHEGIANGRLIVPATSLMVMGFLAPTLLAVHQLCWPESPRTLAISLMAAVISYVPRFVTAARFDRSWFAAALFPLSITIFVILQWVAFIRNMLGSRSTWRGRVYTPTTA